MKLLNVNSNNGEFASLDIEIYSCSGFFVKTLYRFGFSDSSLVKATCGKAPVFSTTLDFILSQIGIYSSDILTCTKKEQPAFLIISILLKNSSIFPTLFNSK